MTPSLDQSGVKMNDCEMNKLELRGDVARWMLYLLPMMHTIIKELRVEENGIEGFGLKKPRLRAENFGLKKMGSGLKTSG